MNDETGPVVVAPWTIKGMPADLRQQLTDDAAAARVSVAVFVERLYRAWKLGEQQRRDGGDGLAELKQLADIVAVLGSADVPGAKAAGRAVARRIRLGLERPTPQRMVFASPEKPPPAPIALAHYNDAGERIE